VSLANRLMVIGAAAGLASSSCAAPHPRSIAYGTETCRHCHMTIADPRYAAELVTKKGMVFVFDDVGCLASFVASGKVQASDIHSICVNDFLSPDSMLRARDAVYLKVDSLQTPMGSHLVALRWADAERMRRLLGGKIVSWEHLEFRGHGS
jgi:copper chaperone NosL